MEVSSQGIHQESFDEWPVDVLDDGRSGDDFVGGNSSAMRIQSEFLVTSSCLDEREQAHQIYGSEYDDRTDGNFQSCGNECGDRHSDLYCMHGNASDGLRFDDDAAGFVVGATETSHTRCKSHENNQSYVADCNVTGHATQLDNPYARPRMTFRCAPRQTTNADLSQFSTSIIAGRGRISSSHTSHRAKVKATSKAPAATGSKHKVCFYDLCPSPLSSNKWRTVTSCTTAGNRAWGDLIGKTLCDSCYSTFRKHGTLVRSVRTSEGWARLDGTGIVYRPNHVKGLSVAGRKRPFFVLDHPCSDKEEGEFDHMRSLSSSTGNATPDEERGISSPPEEHDHSDMSRSEVFGI